jgi:TfoX/Sxy family transcriptional regulator of competence genes
LPYGSPRRQNGIFAARQGIFSGARMATSPDTIAFLFDQLHGLPGVSQRRMFGEYCLYLEGKPVALLCDDRLFVKPTAAGLAVAGDIGEGFPYPGAKPWLLVEGDRWEDREFLQALLRTTAAALPPPKPKKPRRKP